ncbi:Uncharacterized protein BM_BM9575 [Brugia malayi]|uniref:Bm9575 n=1 Tax=Brugia malayi TaxID=6279 RepID=A0A0J9XRZ4_BRUMA|nr:Uncharacterized protein BM_BM9575 [Brugia malayi]CDP94453.1 Bm9575 [Brugia malayi]VIO88962.1 Uncharacterized protein BM_BM9575 [Brugia malayi]
MLQQCKKCKICEKVVGYVAAVRWSRPSVARCSGADGLQSSAPQYLSCRNCSSSHPQILSVSYQRSKGSIQSFRMDFICGIIPVLFNDYQWKVEEKCSL